ncbi:MAG: ATP-binding protein, partial [Oricola sp.]|nr:ATP-binding protein [Oricola sp.]
ALTRALNNLVDNARRYGGGARLECHVSDRGFEIRIEDNGEGIPEEQLESVFETFFRLEGSRSRETGGSGLGLGIARALIRAQGGDIVLSNRPGGGLRASIVFPASRRVQ